MKKLRTTTPASTSRYVNRALTVFMAIVIGASSFVAMNYQSASADQYDAKIAALQSDMARYQKEADRLNSEADSLKTAVARLTNEKNAIQSQVDLSQAQHDKLVIDIDKTEKDIKINQDALGVTLANLDAGDSISTVEMLASSQNISEFITQQEYHTSIKDELGATIKKVKSLKVQLTEQKDEVEKVLAEQKSARDALAAKESEQATLLAQTQNDESKYQGLIKDSQAQIDEARATQAAIRNRVNGSGGATIVDSGSLADYPWNNGNCPMWGYLSTGGSNGNGGDGYGYGCRQCASYVAWRIAKETGIYYSWGNAKDFTYNAQKNGYKYLGMNPEPGSIAVMDPAKAGQGYGHVAWVESVSGNTIIVSQYNYDYGQGFGMYSKMSMSKYAFDHFVKIK